MMRSPEYLDLARRVAWLRPGDPVPDGVPAPKSGDPSPKYARTWALKVLRSNTVRLIASAVPALTPRDLYRLRDLPDLSHWAYRFDVTVRDRLPKVADEESAADEWGIPESDDAIQDERPWGKTFYDKETKTWHIMISRDAKRARDGIRHAFWHEFGHTLPPHTIAKVIGLRRGGTEGDYQNRFASAMAGTNPAEFAVKSDGRGNWGHDGRPGFVGGSGPHHKRWSDGYTLPFDDIDIPDGIGKALVEWKETGVVGPYIQAMLDGSEQMGDASLGDRARELRTEG